MKKTAYHYYLIKFFILFLLTVSIIYGSIHFTIAKSYNTYRANSETIYNIDRLLQNDSTLKSEEEQLIQSLNTLSQIEIPGVKNYSDSLFFSFLGETSKKSKLSISKISSSSFTIVEDLAQLSFDISATGSFKDCLHYLSLIEYGNFIIKVQNISLEKNRGQNLVDMNLQFLLYLHL